MELSKDTVIEDRYIVEKGIGEGGMATVYRVRHLKLNTLHALKVLTLPHNSIRERLLQEGRVQAALRHPNIVNVSDIVDVGPVPGLVMEYIKGPNLDTFLGKHELTIAQIDVLAQGIMRGVAAAHHHGLIHRDLKPANIMLAITDQGLVPKITDFGLVKLLATDGTSSGSARSGHTMGTPSYMAPEQIRDTKGVDKRADIFSLGAILYELVARRRAFDGEDVYDTFSLIMGGTYQPLHELMAEVPARMENAVVGALLPDREERIPNARVLGEVWRGESSHKTEPGADSRVTGPWDAETLERADELGSGGKDALDALRQWGEFTPAEPTMGLAEEEAEKVENVVEEPPAAPEPVPAQVFEDDISDVMAQDVAFAPLVTLSDPLGDQIDPSGEPVESTYGWDPTLGDDSPLARHPPPSMAHPEPDLDDDEPSRGGVPILIVIVGGVMVMMLAVVGGVLAFMSLPEATVDSDVVVDEQPEDTEAVEEIEGTGTRPIRPTDAPPDDVVVSPPVEDEEDPLAVLPDDLRARSAPDRIEAMERYRWLPTSTTALGLMMKHDDSPEVRRQAFVMLEWRWGQKIGPSRDSEALMAWAANYGGATTRLEALSALEDRGKDVTLVTPLLDHASADVRADAVDAVAAIGTRASQSDTAQTALKARLEIETDKKVIRRLNRVIQ